MQQPYAPNFTPNAPPSDGGNQAQFSYGQSAPGYPPPYQVGNEKAGYNAPYPPAEQVVYQPQQSGFQGGYQPPMPGQGFIPPGYQPPQPMPAYAPGQAFSAYSPGPGQQPQIINQQPVINHQPAPGQGGWMNTPQGNANCPPGLEYLTSIDQLLVHQKVELLEVFTGFETNNKFTIKNSLGQKVYWAAEENDCCTRNCCGPIRPFDMKILDIYKNQVIHLNRPLKCQSCWFPCCLQTMEVSAPPGNLIGSIEQNWSILTPDLSIKNGAGETVLKIEGPFCTYTICGDVEFKIVTNDGKQVGKISKQWSGLAREMFTDADHFGITFPMDLDVKMKAVMLGACFLIDAMFFEKKGHQEGDGLGML